jgi:hypothetical protein
MAEARKNLFASATTFAELHAMYAAATNPKNLAADGELTLTEAHARYVQMNTDYEKRNVEIGKSLMGITSNPFILRK